MALSGWPIQYWNYFKSQQTNLCYHSPWIVQTPFSWGFFVHGQWSRGPWFNNDRQTLIYLVRQRKNYTCQVIPANSCKTLLHFVEQARAGPCPGGTFLCSRARAANSAASPNPYYDSRIHTCSSLYASHQPQHWPARATESLTRYQFS